MVNQKVIEKNGQRRNAVVVGLLFITATVVSILSMVNLGSLLGSDTLLTDIDGSETKIIVSVILELVLAVSVAGIGFLFFPILKKENEGLAAGYIVFRVIESMLIIAATVSLISILSIGNEFDGSALSSENFTPVVDALIYIREWSFIIGTMIFLGLGGLLLNYILFRRRLVPRWLSVWGLIGASCVLLYGIISLFGPDPGFLAAPIGIQEMVFAGYLMNKGFRI